MFDELLNYARKYNVYLSSRIHRVCTRVIPREVAQENPRPPSILMKIDKPIVPHDRNMYAQF